MTIVILEDNQKRREAMRRVLSDRFSQFDPRFFATASDTIRHLESHLEDTILIGLDHDLELIPNDGGPCTDPGTGREVADFLAGRRPSCSVIIHTTNEAAGLGMEMALRDAGWRVRRVSPYGDLEWIEEKWFRTVRDAIVRGEATPKAIAPR